MTDKPDVPCWTCGRPMPEADAMWIWDVDPDHETGEVVMAQAASCSACVDQVDAALTGAEALMQEGRAVM
ncbi:MAG: hypothetical protein GOVbin1573_10 [Prokaryotic dsDNA virus sp.]|nr:MAG: hypothetical protein GOVbin1573_10 [Prokaryotic dsDNA virus sp.]